MKRPLLPRNLVLLASASLLVPLANLAGEIKLGPMISEADFPIVSEFIYELEGRLTPQCHSSTIIETESGLVAAWFGGTHEKNDDVGIWVSRHVDGKWGTPFEVANGVQSMDLRYPTWNPVLFQPTDGPLMLFYKVGPDPRTWWGMLTVSEDDGETWSWPTKLGEEYRLGPLLGPIKNKPIELADGTIINPSSYEIELEDGTDIWNVHFEISRDGGQSWDVVGPIADPEGLGAIQPSILTYSNGDMQVLCRSRKGVVAQSWSRDGGRNWEPLSATELPNPNSGTDAVTLADGRQLIIYNHSVKRGEFPNNRSILNLAISDDGLDWDPILTLEKQEGEYSYPAIIQGADGMVHMTYTYRRQTVKYVTFDPRDIVR
jgi:predicted neuraminidase